MCYNAYTIDVHVNKIVDTIFGGIYIMTKKEFIGVIAEKQASARRIQRRFMMLFGRPSLKISRQAKRFRSADLALLKFASVPKELQRTPAPEKL